jgi:hypothetical protein
MPLDSPDDADLLTAEDLTIDDAICEMIVLREDCPDGCEITRMITDAPAPREK